MQEQRVQLADGVLGLRLVAGADGQALATAADVGALGDDVQGGPAALRREQPHRVALGVAVVADLLGQADRGQRAAGAEAVVVGDGRPVEGAAQAADAPLPAAVTSGAEPFFVVRAIAGEWTV